MREYFNPLKNKFEYEFAGMLNFWKGASFIFGYGAVVSQNDVIRIKKKIWFSQKRKIASLLYKHYRSNFSNKEIAKIVKNIESSIEIGFFSGHLRKYIAKRFTNEDYFYVVESLDRNGIRNEKFEDLLITSQERITKLKTVGVNFVEPARVIVTR